jgi:hypothetical protein
VDGLEAQAHKKLTYAQRAAWMIGGFSKRLRGWPLPCPRNRSSVIRRYGLRQIHAICGTLFKGGLILKVEKIR